MCSASMPPRSGGGIARDSGSLVPHRQAATVAGARARASAADDGGEKAFAGRVLRGPTDGDRCDGRGNCFMAAPIPSNESDRLAAERLHPASGLPNRSRFLQDIDACIKGQAHEAPETAILVIDAATPDQYVDLARALGERAADSFEKASAERIGGLLPAGTGLYHLSAARFGCILPPESESRITEILDGLADNVWRPTSSCAIPAATARQSAGHGSGRPPCCAISARRWLMRVSSIWSTSPRWICAAAAASVPRRCFAGIIRPSGPSRRASSCRWSKVRRWCTR